MEKGFSENFKHIADVNLSTRASTSFEIQYLVRPRASRTRVRFFAPEEPKILRQSTFERDFGLGDIERAGAHRIESSEIDEIIGNIGKGKESKVLGYPTIPDIPDHQSSISRL